MNTESIIQIVQYSFLGILGLIVIIEFFRGMSRGLIFSLIRLALTVGALVLTYITFNFVIGMLQPMIDGKLAELMAGREDLAILNQVPMLVDYVIVVVESLFGPIVFSTLFFLWLIICRIVGAIIKAIDKKLKMPKMLLSRLLGAVISIVSGGLAFLVLFMPVFGYADNVPQIYNAILESEIIESDESLDEAKLVIDDITLMSPIKAMQKVTKPLFDYSATIKVKDFEINAFTEFYGIIDIVPAILDLKDIDFSDLSNVKVDAIDSLAQKVSEKDNLKILVADIISSAGTSWKNGEAFLGINLKENIGESAAAFTDVFDVLFEKLSGCTKDNIVDLTHEFTSAIKSASHIIDYLNSLNAEDGSFDISLDKLADALKGLDASTVELIKPIISQDIFEAAGLDENNATLASEVIISTIEAIADMSDEDIDREAEAINTLMSYALDAEDKPDTDATINALISSDLILNAVQTVTESSPEETSAILSGMSEEDKAAINASLDKYQQDNPDVPTEKIDILKSLFGIE